MLRARHTRATHPWALLAACVLIAASLLCCREAGPPPQTAPLDPLQEQKRRASEGGRNAALENLRLASMALAVDDLRLAEQALLTATSMMTNFQADGEYAAMLGAESSKEWKGEPYEKMAAFVQLGMLLYQRGEHGNALAAFKQALLADTGTAQEQFRSDFTAAWVLQALVYQAVGEHHNARMTLDRAVDSRWGRATLRAISRALAEVEIEGLSAEELDGARVVLHSSTSAGVSAHPRDPGQAVAATISHAASLLLQQRQLKKKHRMPEFQQLKRRDFDEIGEVLPAVADAWRLGVEHLPPSATAEAEAFARAMEALTTQPPNVVILVEWGDGPVKTRTGRYGHLLTIVPVREQPPPAPLPTFDGAVADALWLDNATFQATTRGGRGVDSFLEGKAVYKDVAGEAGWAMLWVGEAVMHAEVLSDADSGGAVGAIVTLAGLAAMASAAATHPEADIRQWHAVPEDWYLVTAHVPTGDHVVRVGGLEVPLSVPEYGRSAMLIALPDLVPGDYVGHR